jgi:predicted nucleic acid-binding protein
MDTCCYKRPFDDQTQERIYVESEIILLIMAKCDKGEWALLSSKVLEYEFSNDKNIERSQYMIALYCNGDNIYPVTDSIEQRAKHFQEHGVKLYDSLHLATAEHANADVLLTVDDQFINSSKRTDSQIRVINPISFMEDFKWKTQ